MANNYLITLPGPVAQGPAPTSVALFWAVYNANGISLSDTNQAPLQLDSSGNLCVNVKAGGSGGGTVNQGNQGTAAEGWFVELTDGTNVLGTSTHPLRIDPVGTTTQPVSLSAATGTGFHISSNSVQAIKSSAGTLWGYFLDNSANSATTYFQIFNVASGSVTLGTTTPAFVIPVPAGLAANLCIAMGSAFSTAMSFAATTTYNGSTAPSSAVDCTIWWS